MPGFNHGIGTTIKDIVLDKGTVEVGRKGIVTAYLPSEDRFAIDFGNGYWITFDKVSLDMYCEVELYDGIENYR